MRSRGQWQMSVATLALALAIAACGGGGGATKPATPDAAATAAPSGGPGELAGPTYPLTVTDMLGRRVTLNASPFYVAALSATTVEEVFAVGARSVTRPASAVYPPAAQAAIDIGPVDKPNLQLVLAQKPDLIVADVLQKQLLPSLEATGVPVLFVGAETYADVPAGVRLLGRVLDKALVAENAATNIAGALSSVQHDLPATRPRVIILDSGTSGLAAATPASYAGDLVNVAGARNVVEGAPNAAATPGYATLTVDAIVASRPDVILTIAPADGAPSLAQTILTDPAWADVPAVKSGRVTDIDAGMFLTAPGTRAIAAIQTLARLLYPAVFAPAS